MVEKENINPLIYLYVHSDQDEQTIKSYQIFPVDLQTKRFITLHKVL